MTTNRRSASKTIAGAIALPTPGPISNAFGQADPNWITYEIVTKVSLESPNGTAETWFQ